MRRGKYSRARGVRRSWWPLIISSIVLATMLVASGVWWYTHKEDNTQPRGTVNQQEDSAELAYEAIEGRYLFHGTIAWDRAIERDARGDFSRPFSLLSTFEREKYDAWIADLECPSTNTTVPYETQVNSLIFNCPTAFNTEAKKYFDILNLANNHTHDLGYEGFLETQKNLTNAGFQVYGSQDLTDEENYCEVIDLPIRLKAAGKEDTQASLPIAFCAYHAVSRSPTAEELGVVADYAKITVIATGLSDTAAKTTPFGTRSNTTPFGVRKPAAGTSAPSSSTMSMPSFSLPTMNNGSYTGKVPTSTVQKKDIQIPDFLRNR